MPAVPLTPYLQYLTSNGLPRNAGLVYTYAAGTTTPKATFTTAAGDAIAQNPVQLNSAGEPDHGSGNIGLIWIQGSYDFLITNSDGTDPIWMRNVTSFNTIAPAGASYYQTFTGDGVQTTFPLSQPLGTDENAVLFFIDSGLANFISNGDFSTDTIWNKGAGWLIQGGAASTNAVAISTSINQTANDTINPGQSYNVTYTITRTAGTITPNIGGTAGTTRSAAGTYIETIIAGATQSLGFDTAGFNGTVDNVSVKLIESQGRQVSLPTEFTLNNTSISFAKPPKSGSLVFGFAFSTLVAAASASAAAAEAFSQAANVSAMNAASSAASFIGSSATSVLIANGSKSFTTQTGKSFAAGQFLTISSAANVSNFMYGQVTSYNTANGALVVNVTENGGAGTFNDWVISISGTKGIPGTVTPSNGSVTPPKMSDQLLLVHGQCRLALNGANLTLSAYNGQYLNVNGTPILIPNAGVNLAATGLLATTVYYIYAYLSGAVLTLEASTTGHSRNTNGIEIKTGDATRTLVGMAFTAGAATWGTGNADVASWFNRRTVSVTGVFTTTRTTTSSTPIEINAEIRCNFLTWSDEAVSCKTNQCVSNGLQGTNVLTELYIDGTLALAGGTFQQPATYIPASIAVSDDVIVSEGRHYLTIFGATGANTASWYSNASYIQASKTIASVRI